MVFNNVEVPILGVAASIDFVAQAKLVRFVNAGASALHAVRFGFNPGDATGTQGIGRTSAKL